MLSKCLSSKVLMLMMIFLSFPAQSEGWKINADMDDDITNYKSNSPYIQDMFTYGPQNVMTYIGSNDSLSPVMPVYDLFACIQLSYPDNYVKAETAGGIHFEIDQIPYARGAWDTIFRMEEASKIDELDQEKYLRLSYLRIGTNEIEDTNFQKEALKILTKKCL